MASIELTQVPTEPMDWAHWGFANAAHHRDIIRVILRDRNIILDEYVLDPVDLRQFESWLHLHATMHLQQNAVLGIQGYDLTQLDPENPEDMVNWINQHADEHFRAGQILNLE